MKLRNITPLLITCALTCAVLSGCATTSIEKSDDIQTSSNFVIVEQTDSYAVAYDKETRVMYAISASRYNYGNFTLLVNPDGSPKIYGEA